MKLLGLITKEECDELRKIFHRKNALTELLISFEERQIDKEQTEGIYKRLIDDYTIANIKMSEWWIQTAQLHDWKYTSDNSWRVNFETCEVFLTD